MSSKRRKSRESTSTPISGTNPEIKAMLLHDKVSKRSFCSEETELTSQDGTEDVSEILMFRQELISCILISLSKPHCKQLITVFLSSPHYQRIRKWIMKIREERTE